MMSSQFDPGSTSKTLNISLLRFNERSGFQNLGVEKMGDGEGEEEGEGWERKKTHHVVVDNCDMDSGCWQCGWWRLTAGW